MTTITARELMTPDVATVREDMPVPELADFLAEKGITGAAVKNDQGRLVGVVSLSDVAAHSGERSDIVRDESQPDFYVRGWEEIYNREEVVGLHIEHSDLLVRDILNPAVFSVPEDTEVSEVAEAMIRGRLHRMFVSRGDELAGIITTSDFLRLFVAEHSASTAVFACFIATAPRRAAGADQDR